MESRQKLRHKKPHIWEREKRYSHIIPYIKEPEKTTTLISKSD